MALCFDCYLQYKTNLYILIIQTNKSPISYSFAASKCVRTKNVYIKSVRLVQGFVFCNSYQKV